MKKIIGIAISVLMATLFCVTAFAVEPRWKNVIAISPTISAESQSYSSYIVADPKATKMESAISSGDGVSRFSLSLFFYLYLFL